MSHRKNNKERFVSINFSELLYLSFFGIMLFAKGIGLYDGQIVYKLVFLVSFACLGLKMLITKHTYREWFLIIALSLLAILVYLRSREKGILICTAMIMAMKNVSLERVFKLGLGIWSISAGGMFLYSLMNMNQVHMEVQCKFGQMYVPRYFMGFPHPNVLHVSYFVFIVLYLWVIREKYTWKHLLGLMLGNVFLFIYSFSVTGFATVAAFLILAFYIKVKKINNIDYWLVRIACLGCLGISMILPIVAGGKILQLADKIFNHRIGYSKHFVTINNLKLFGNNLAEITDSILTMDNSFVFSLIIYGVIAFALILIAYYVLIENCIRENKHMELAIIVSYFIAGITEPMLFNTSFKNLSLVYIGAVLFQMTAKKGKKEFALIKGKDYPCKITAISCDIMRLPLREIYTGLTKRIIIVVGTIAAVIGVAYGTLKEIPVRILERREEEIPNIMFWEQIRSSITTFLIVYLLLVVGIGISKYLYSKKQEVKNS